MRHMRALRRRSGLEWPRIANPVTPSPTIFPLALQNLSLLLHGKFLIRCPSLALFLFRFIKLITTLPFKPPPPTLREILGAYRSRGDGDREMLMAMLHAKSAEDQV